MGIGLQFRGGAELAARFETLSGKAHDKILGRMGGLVDRLTSLARAAAPNKTGKLRSEIVGRVYDDTKSRIAGYVSVFAPEGGAKEYPKAATLEFGSNRVRKTRVSRFSDKLGRMSKRRIVARVTKPVTIAAYRYLRGSLRTL